MRSPSGPTGEGRRRRDSGSSSSSSSRGGGTDGHRCNEHRARFGVGCAAATRAGLSHFPNREYEPPFGLDSGGHDPAAARRESSQRIGSPCEILF
mmetsp:Transcript_42286/g.128297  ORF Transcript_42286/g.128297 Transcript_42286/m.128297 type:complete len:95 (-) Transcript_42286:373-657(-)